MSDNIEVQYVKIEDLEPGDVVKGYFGGTYTNKFGYKAATLYRKTAEGGYLCQCVPLYKAIKEGIAHGTGHLDITYIKTTQKGEFKNHSFNVKCKPIPMADEKAVKFMGVLQVHTASLDQPDAVKPKKQYKFADEDEPKAKPKAQAPIDDTDIPF